MYKIAIIITFCFASGIGSSETVDAVESSANKNQNIFAVNQAVESFSNQNQLNEYLKSNKPSTFRYFDRLNFQAKKQVLKKHQENQAQDITEIVLHVYRTNR